MTAAAVMTPIIALLLIALEIRPVAWLDLLTGVRLQAFAYTALLCAGVGCVVTCLGTSLAWLVTAYAFKSRQVLKIALLLPMAIPTYIMAYAYLDLLHPLGPVQSWLRTLLDISSPKGFRLPDLRTLPSAIFLLGFVLFPYVYLSTKAMFLTLPANLIDSARSLGASPAGVFWRLALPHARPGLIAGIGIALLETINDVGASEFLGVRTVTVELYTTWISKSDLAGAAKIAIMLLSVMLLFSMLEKAARRRMVYSQTKNTQALQPRKLRGWQACIAITLGWLPVVIGFVLPAGFLTSQVIQRSLHQEIFTQELNAAALSSLTIATIVTCATIVLGVILVWSMTRLKAANSSLRLTQIILNTSKFGYFLPGTVLAIGLLSPFSFIDHLTKRVLLFVNIEPGTLLMLGTSAGIVTACTIRFLGMAVSTIEAGYSRISARLDQAARSLGRSALVILTQIHLPILKPALFSAALLIFVETMKELPTTLLLRPLNTETLATLLYAEASRGNYEDGSTAALLIVALGIVPLIYLTRLEQKQACKS